MPSELAHGPEIVLLGVRREIPKSHVVEHALSQRRHRRLLLLKRSHLRFGNMD
jgi:hypothetical protein